MVKVRRDQLRRLERLKKLYAEGPLWGIVARFKNGTVKTLSAAEYQKVKLRNPEAVSVIDRKITNNLAELKAWLDMVYYLAIEEQDEELRL